MDGIYIWWEKMQHLENTWQSMEQVKFALCLILNEIKANI